MYKIKQATSVVVKSRHHERCQGLKRIYKKNLQSFKRHVHEYILVHKRIATDATIFHTIT